MSLLPVLPLARVVPLIANSSASPPYIGHPKRLRRPSLDILTVTSRTFFLLPSFPRYNCGEKDKKAANLNQMWSAIIIANLAFSVRADRTGTIAPQRSGGLLLLSNLKREG